MTASCPNRRRAKRTPSSILVRTFCLRRCAAISATSPNQDGVEGTDSAEVWMITDRSAILVICTSLRESVLFFLLKEAHFMLARSFLAARCAIRGIGNPFAGSQRALHACRFRRQHQQGSHFILFPSCCSSIFHLLAHCVQRGR